MEKLSSDPRRRIALGKRFRSLPSFHCLGVNPNWEDYSQGEMRNVEEAGIIYYPSSLYEDFFLSLGKKVFPRNYYRFMGNKIRQTNLFQLLDIPHPRTRLYYGRNPLAQILADFQLPFIGKTSLGSSKGKGVFLIKDGAQLENYLRTHRPAYIQEYLPVDRDLRVVVLAGKAVHAYWRIQRPGEFRNNVFQGATISFADIPPEAVEFAEDVARRCRFDEVGLDVCRYAGRYYVLEANMVYGLEGFRQAGVDIYEVLARMDRRGVL